MPEAVATLVATGDVQATQQVLQDILNAYVLDFSKHADNKDIPKIQYIWSSIPSQLARDNKKFLYQTVREGARARDYEDALLWLSHAGLLRRLSLLDPIAVKEGNRLFTEFKGALTENFVLQHLVACFEGTPRYWTSGNQAEVDFLLQVKNDIIPIEVKAEENVRGRSLTIYNQHYNPPVRLRYSLRNLKMDDGMLNIPLFMVDYTEKLLNLRR